MPYTWNPMPDALDIRCPACSNIARFAFAKVVRIREKKDVPFFQNNDQFDYARFQDSCGHFWHGAIFLAGLHGGSHKNIRELPNGYDRAQWRHSRYLLPLNSRIGNGLGAVICGACKLRQKHRLQWPGDAFFQVHFKGDVLWAFDRESAVALRDHIATTNRNRNLGWWRCFLMKAPKKFLQKNARSTIVKRLDRLILV